MAPFDQAKSTKIWYGMKQPLESVLTALNQTRLLFLLEHDLFRKPVSTFPDQAPARTTAETSERIALFTIQAESADVPQLSSEDFGYSVFERNMSSGSTRGWIPVRVKKTRQIRKIESFTGSVKW
ncbi:hypothetical protein [Nitrobacter winogradskyi]|uniref:Uncharacterized protein n=1 Tax=Nitrobacter winogradskyi TaxID=913 RepID=A0ACC6ANR2_NITWI|nr:hypothetical protein [Nitrobacter winogradskyi]MCP2000802.1 hypothetical protein [Nitrobacter winogradskyi]